jgi:hypothetical protein
MDEALERMQARLVECHRAELVKERATEDVPPGLDVKQSWYTEINNPSVASKYRSPAKKKDEPKVNTATEEFDIGTPVSDKVAVSTEAQTDLSFAVDQSMMVWTSGKVCIGENGIEGDDANITLAVAAQARDVLPEATQLDVEVDDDDNDDDDDDDTGIDTMDESIVGHAIMGNVTVVEPVVENDSETAETSVRAIVEQIESTAAPPPTTPASDRHSRRRDFVLPVTPPSPIAELETEPEMNPLMPIAPAKKILVGKLKECGCGDESCKTTVGGGAAKPKGLAAAKIGGERVRLRRGITMDTGAHHNVIPRRMVGKHRIRESPGSKRGMNYVGAGGEKIANEGEADFPFETVEGDKMSMIAQIAEVSKPLGSVAYFVDRYYRVVYDKNMETGEDISYMIHKLTKKVHRFRRERNIWILDAMVDLSEIFDSDFSRPE